MKRACYRMNVEVKSVITEIRKQRTWGIKKVEENLEGNYQKFVIMD